MSDSMEKLFRAIGSLRVLAETMLHDHESDVRDYLADLDNYERQEALETIKQESPRLYAVIAQQG
jgi:hypothetical protein